MEILNFSDYSLYEAKNFKAGDKWEWHTVEYDPKRKNNYRAVKKVEIAEVKPNGDVVGRLEGNSETFIIRDASKHLKKKLNEELNEDLDAPNKALYRLAHEYHNSVAKHHEAQKEFLNAPKDKIALREDLKNKMLQLHRDSEAKKSEFIRQLADEEGGDVYEALMAVGYGPTYQGNYFSMANSYPTTGYSLTPVVAQLDETATSLVNGAKEYDENDNPDHTGHGYMQESLNYFNNKIKHVYQDKMAAELPLVNDVFDPRFKGSDVASSGGVAGPGRPPGGRYRDAMQGNT
jgi:hypothetical protein